MKNLGREQPEMGIQNLLGEDRSLRIGSEKGFAQAQFSKLN